MPDWKTDLSSRERVRQIIETVRDPVPVGWIIEQADVNRQVARDELERLAARGRVHRVGQNDEQYVPDFTWLYMERVLELALNNSRDDLEDAQSEAREEIHCIRETYEVDSRDNLEQSLARQSCSAKESRERLRALRKWELTAEELRLLEHALDLLEDLRAVDPYLQPSSPGGPETE